MDLFLTKKALCRLSYWGKVGPAGLEPAKDVVQLIYSQSPLPLGTRTPIQLLYCKPLMGLEPMTFRLQGERSAN